MMWLNYSRIRYYQEQRLVPKSNGFIYWVISVFPANIINSFVKLAESGIYDNVYNYNTVPIYVSIHCLDNVFPRCHFQLYSQQECKIG